MGDLGQHPKGKEDTGRGTGHTPVSLSCPGDWAGPQVQGATFARHQEMVLGQRRMEFIRDAASGQGAGHLAVPSSHAHPCDWHVFDLPGLRAA